MALTRFMIVLAWLVVAVLIGSIIGGLMIFFDGDSYFKPREQAYWFTWSISWIIGVPLLSWIATGDTWYVLNAVFNFLIGGTL